MFKGLLKRAKDIVTDHTGEILRVNCMNLVPGTKQVPRPHCDMGDGREGDCLVYLKKKESCIHHDPKFVPLSRDEIKEKVRDKVLEQAYIKSCLDVCICPECGHDLAIICDDDHGLDDGECPICQKTYPIY